MVLFLAKVSCASQKDRQKYVQIEVLVRFGDLETYVHNRKLIVRLAKKHHYFQSYNLVHRKFCNRQTNIIIIIIIFWLKHQYLKHKYQSMVQQIIANMLSETVYTGITNLYIITKNQQNTKQYIINVNSVF